MKKKLEMTIFCYDYLIDKLGPLGDKMKEISKDHMKSLLYENCSVEFIDAIDFQYLLASDDIPVLERNFEFNALFSYDCGSGEKQVLCKNFEWKIKPGLLTDGFIISGPMLKLHSSPNYCEPLISLDALELFGLLYKKK